MKKYDPSQTPIPDEWLEIDELLRLESVKQYHQLMSVEFEEGAEELHALIHVIVENQVALKIEPVQQTINKLIRQGLSRHESIHAIGAVLSDGIFEMLKNSQPLDIKKYRNHLDKLTAKRWRKGKW